MLARETRQPRPPRPPTRDALIPDRRAPHASWGLREGDEVCPGRIAVRPIGGGSLYEVVLVWDEVLHSLCVAKLIRPDRLDEERSLRDLRREAEILDLLGHPMIVRRFDTVIDGPRPHLLLEHLEGPSLRRLIRRGGALPLQQLVPLALSLAGALAYLDAMDIVHLDVKPDNIIMGVPPRLIDLSVARRAAEAQRIRKPIGTDPYMAPEQCDADRFPGRIGPQADVWGLGATLHHALSGHRPFPRPKGAGDSDDPLLRFPQLHSRPEPLPAHLPRQLVSLIESMLGPDPHGRPSAAEVAAGLEPIVGELPRKLTLSRGARVW